MLYRPALLIFLTDQLAKFLTQKFLQMGQSFPIVKGFFHLTYVQNKGAAFGIQVNQKFLILTAVLVIGLVIYFYYRIKNYSLAPAALSFILGGSFSNLWDRLFRGYVVDMFDFRIWPVFNLADVAINLGVGILIYDWLMRRK